MDKRQLQRIKVLQAISKAKNSGKVYIRPKRELIDTSSKHLPTKRDFQETIVHYIKTNRK